MGLDLPAYLRSQSRDKTTQEELRRQSNNTIHKIFELQKVRADCGAPCMFAKGTDGILVLRRGESCLQRLEETWPRGELTITGHPLKPGQGVPLHVEGGDGQSIVLGRGMVIEELVDLKDLTKGFDPIKAGNIEFQAMRGGGGHGWWVIGRRKGWRWSLRLG